MIDQFINFVIRPPRAEYNPDQYLWEKNFTLAGRKYKRQDLELRNERGHTLRCSHYVPSHFPDGTSLPCVIYCHGNSGCRADANEAAVILLPSNITLFTLDFSGSGLSGGNYVSLGWHEKNDLKIVVSHLRSNTNISRIGLWGRSMGAVTSLLYGAEDPSIAGMVLDSAFSNLFDLMMELVDVYKIRLPKFTVKVAVQYMRRVIQKKAKFDIMNLSCVQVAPRTYIPALFGHAKDDKFIQSHHSDLIFESYAGDKNMIKFDGDHNSSRPQFYYDSVSIFFYNVLHPPQLPSAHSGKADKYYDLGDLKVNANGDENLLCEKIAGNQSSGADVASSSSIPPCISTAKSVGELLSEIAPVASVLDTLIVEDNIVNSHDSSMLQAFMPLMISLYINSNQRIDHIFSGKPCGQNEESCSYTSSNRESWGRCSSLGSDEEPISGCPSVVNGNQMTIKVLATPPRDVQQTALDLSLDEKNRKKTPRKKKSKRENFEKLEALTQRLRHCILKRVSHRRHCSS